MTIEGWNFRTNEFSLVERAFDEVAVVFVEVRFRVIFLCIMTDSTIDSNESSSLATQRAPFRDPHHPLMMVRSTAIDRHVIWCLQEPIQYAISPVE